MTRAWSWLFSVIALGTLALLLGIFVAQSIPVWRHEGGAISRE
jgi:phosphate transport system permease protein